MSICSFGFLIMPVPGLCLVSLAFRNIITEKDSFVQLNVHYVNVSVFIKFSQKTSVFTLIIISSP